MVQYSSRCSILAIDYDILYGVLYFEFFIHESLYMCLETIHENLAGYILLESIF